MKKTLTKTVNLAKLPPQAQLELLDFYEFLLGKYVLSKAPQVTKKTGGDTQPQLGDLAVRLFGTAVGIELDLPRHPPHRPFELGQ